MRFVLCSLALLPLIWASKGCNFQPILKGVSIKQSLGESQKKLYTTEPDCKRRCSSETQFNCTSFLWGGDQTSDCYLFDKIDLQRQIFVDQRAYLLYVEVCDGEPVPSIGYCQFLLNQTGVTALKDGTVSPGFTSESSCREFCIANYWGKNCDAFVVSPDRASECSLYAVAPSSLSPGSQNLWTKNCFPPPANCEYSEWSEWSTCSKSCDGGSRSRTRNIVKEGSENGVHCMENEKTQNGGCAEQTCLAECHYSEWSSFGPCRKVMESVVEHSCSTKGQRTRNKTLVGSPLGCFPQEEDTKECTDPSFCSDDGNTCIYNAWSEWTVCSSTCTSTRTRTLEIGNEAACEQVYGPLENNIACEGGECGGIVSPTTVKFDGGHDQPSISTTTTSTPNGNGGSNGNNGNNGNGNNVPESGCRVVGVDPSTRPSSQGYKAVGVRPDCALMCKQETKFTCAGYTTTGPGGPCQLHGAIDRPVTLLPNSHYYLQDINCATNHSGSGTGVCQWKLNANGVNDPSFSAPGRFVSIGLTIDAAHCGTLCMMNYPLFRPNGCKAYAWNPLIPFQSSRDNCFMYDHDITTNTTVGGTFEIYRLECP